MTLIGPTFINTSQQKVYQKSVYSPEHNFSAIVAIGWFEVRGYIDTVIFQHSAS
jgi:hypothetical protein